MANEGFLFRAAGDLRFTVWIGLERRTTRFSRGFGCFSCSEKGMAADALPFQNRDQMLWRSLDAWDGGMALRNPRSMQRKTTKETCRSRSFSIQVETTDFLSKRVTVRNS